MIGRNSSSGQPSTISDCFTDVDIYALDTSARRIGGITGLMLSGWSDVTGYPMLIDNCYSLGSITGDQEIGGLVGVVQVHANGDLITIKDSYSISNIPDNTLNGGLIGRRIGTSQTINCFWNAETTAALSGVGDGSEAGIVQKTTSEMQTLSTYINAGWDFQAETVNGQEDNWTFVANDYPHLAWEGYTNELTSPPLNLQAAVEDGSITLTWSPPQGQTPASRAFLGYNVYRDSIQINTQAVLEATYIDRGLIHAQTYTYYVRALYDEGESEASNTIDAQAINLHLSGQGTETNPYLINNLADLFILSQKNIYWAPGTYLEQTADIDASASQNWDNGAGFSPIGNDVTAFCGHYNGNNYMISNLHINRPNTNKIGLFGYSNNANILDICITEVDIIGDMYVGSLAGFSQRSSFNNIYVNGSVSGNETIGAVVGNLNYLSIINNSYATGLVSGNSIIGGLVGMSNSNPSSTINNSYSVCSVSGSSSVGGLIGLSSFLTINNCFATGSVSGDMSTGGLIGFSYSSSVNDSFWDTQTSNQDTSPGGTGLTTAQMQTLSTYINAGWDFQAETDNGTNDIWTFVANDYPHLTWEGYESQLTSPPVNLQASVEDGAINLAWSPPQQETQNSRARLGYNVYRDSIQINTVTVMDTLFIDDNVENRQTYSYYVTALYDEGESVASNLIEVEALDFILIGEGTENSPYQINDLADLYILSKNNSYWSSGLYFEQTADIDASASQNWDNGAGFSSIGLQYNNKFSGNYNGNNFIISSLYINRTNTLCCGLFGYIDGANIINVGLIDAEIIGRQDIGALIGKSVNSSTIDNCYATGTVTCNYNTVGVLIGSLDSSIISNCYATGTASGPYNSGGLIGSSVASSIDNCYASTTVNGPTKSGGLLGGLHSSTLSNSYATGNVSGTSNIGGLAGSARDVSSINNCYATGNASGSDNVGGLFGQSVSTVDITNSYCIGSVSGTEYVGGLVGYSRYSVAISNCYATGTVSGDSEVAGLVGFLLDDSSITNSYATGDVSGTLYEYGGLVGSAVWASISNSYSTGLVSGTGTDFGGLIGHLYDCPVISSFWDTSTSNQITSAGGTGLTTAEMQTLSTYLDGDWDFVDEIENGTNDIWTFVANDYPHLTWEGYTTELTSPPVNLQASVDDGVINLTWSPPQEQTPASRAFLGYNVYRDSIQINTESILDTLYSDTDLVHEQSYTYYVRALYDEGESEPTNTIDAQAIYLFLSGQGTEANPYLINNLTDLYILSQKNMYWAPGTYLEQTADIDASDTQNWDNGAGFSPIGNYRSAFKGSYNGNNYTILNLYIDRPETSDIGLFGRIDEAHTSDIGVINVEFIGRHRVGGLIGYSSVSSTVSNCYSTGSVTGDFEVGGLIGSSSSTVSNCYSTGVVSGEFAVGGLVGYSYSSSTVSNCYSTGAVSGENSVGGLVGNSYSSVNNSFWDTESTNQTTSSGGGTGLATVGMQTLSTYLDAGWDFENESANGSEDVWKLPYEGEMYPLLSWQTNNLIALISADKTQAPVNESIQFTSNSMGNIDYWEWDFDNDGFIDSYEENPIHSYSQPGYYSIVLTVSNDDLEIDTNIYQNYIHIYNVDIQNGLYAYYPFNNNADDQSENNLDADVYGASLTTDRFGNEDSAYAFDGLDDYIDCPDGFADFSNGITISYWSCQEAFNNWSRIIDFGNGSRSDNIIITPAALGSNALQFQVYRGSSSSNIRLQNVISLDTWSFWVAEVNSSGYAKVYKDNVLIGQGDIGIPNNIERINNYIGRSNWAADGYYDGKIDDLRIYNRLLFEEEREELYNLVETVEIPNNVSVSSQDNQITISWDTVPGATSYKIFASDFPNGEFIDVSEDGTFEQDPALVSNFSLTSQRNNYNNSSRFRSRISWVISTDSQRKFYRIKAVQ